MTVQKVDRRAERTARPGGRTDVLDLALAAVAEPVPALSGGGRWWVTGARGGLELHARVGGQLSGATQRLTRLVAGSALLAVRLAVAVSGSRPFTTVLPDPRRPRVVAIVRHGAPAPPTRAERTLFAVLAGARPPASVAVPDVAAALPLLRSAADAEGAWSRSVTDPRARERLTRLLGPGLGTSSDDRLLVLGSHHLRPSGDVQAGQALERVLLTVRSLGLGASVLAGPPELEALHPGDVPGAGSGLLPQVVLRLTGPCS